MSKHRLSPAPLPPSKRLHTLSKSDSNSRPLARLALDYTALYDELILCVFSHLSWTDLCAAQGTNRNWARLAADNELWRNLYLRIYGRRRLRGIRGFLGRTDGREVKALPGRAKVEDLKDWKWMFRISSNWKTGRCSVEQLPESIVPSGSTEEWVDDAHILLAGSLTITAYSRMSTAPTVQLHGVSGSPIHSLLCASSRSDTTVQITAMSLDQSLPVSGHLNLAVFLSSGEFIVFSVNHAHPSMSVRKSSYVPARNNRTAPIIQAAYHHPLLTSLSKAFSLSIYDLSSDSVRHTQTLTSFTSHPPTSLVLSTPSSTTYKLVLAYAIPVYPSHWSVGATELVISGTGYSASMSSILSSSSSSSSHTDDMHVISTRTARAFDAPQGWIDEHKLRAMREQWHRRVSKVADTQTDGKWVVLAPGLRPSDWNSISSPTSSGSSSNTPSPSSHPSLHSPTDLQLYRLSLPSTSSMSSSPKLTFVRNLTGQSGPISTLALADGRCVSLGLNGSIWVWDLEGDTGAEVSEPQPSFPTPYPNSKRAVVFDERRIITAEAGRVLVRRFDI